MILVAIAGEVGIGKSSLLATVASRAEARGLRVHGFVAEAQNRPEADAAQGRGADAYALKLYPSGGEALPYARRLEEGEVPYEFDVSVEDRAWAQVGPCDLLVIDEFGKREADGEGHIRHWPRVLELEIPVVIVAVRAGVEELIAAHLGRPFDLVLHPAEPAVAARLSALVDGGRDWDRVAVFGGAGGAVETTLGSALHGGSVPLRGQVLSTLQAMLLTSAAEGLSQRPRVAWVGLISSGLKALSPAGSRVRPMIAIATQGLLFGATLSLLGWNTLSVFVAGFLLGVWATVQGIVLSLFILGGSVVKAYDEAARWLAERLGVGAPSLAMLMAIVCGLSGLFTAGACLVQWRWRHRGLPNWLQNRGAQPTASAVKTAGWWQGVFLELVRPGFWVPLLVVIGILGASGTGAKDLLPVVARGAFVSLVLVVLVRLIRPVQAVAWLRNRGYYGPSVALGRVLGLSSVGRISAPDEAPEPYSKGAGSP